MDFEWVEVGNNFSANTSSTSVTPTAYGVCQVCGKKAYHHRAKVCEDHRGERGNGRSASKSASKSNRSSDTGGNRSGNGPNSAAWSRTVSKVLLLVTSFVAVGIVSRANILDSDETLTDALSLTVEEADDIAKPIARVVSRTSISRKYGAAIVENDDLIDAGLAVSDYLQRVRQTTQRIEQIVRNREQGRGAYGPNANNRQQPSPVSGMPSPTGDNFNEFTEQATSSGPSDGNDGGSVGEHFGPTPGDFAYPIFDE